MRNRYTNLLKKYNRQILELNAANPYMFYVCAFELARRYKKGDRVLEIGCGEGDSAMHLLERTDASIDLLDVSREMLTACKKRLRAYVGRINFIRDDALHYLATAQPYNVIFSSWTIHNFRRNDKARLLAAIYANLKPGGTFLMIDKVYPGGTSNRVLLEKQNERYRLYMARAAARAIIAHEIKDATKRYRMDEGQLVRAPKRIGFRDICIRDRVEREIVLTAQK